MLFSGRRGEIARNHDRRAEALDACIRYARARCGYVPIDVAENGVATEDDTRRDNFEWIMGYHPKFGLIAVDRETQERRVKPSAHYLGAIARGNRTPEPASIVPEIRS